MVKVNWVYYLNKEELIKYSTEFGLSNIGTVDELRKRLATFLQEEGESEGLRDRVTDLSLRHAKLSTITNSPTPRQKESLQLPQSQRPSNDGGTEMSPRMTETYTHVYPQLSNQSVMDRVRKWGVKYDGGKDPLGFIERVEELAHGYEIELNALPRALPELLKDRALVWLRNNHGQWQNWETFKRDFLKFFLNSRYFERLDDEIRQRVQRPKENFKDYVLALQGLMKHSEYTPTQKLQRIYRNCRSDYQLYIKESEFGTLTELVSLAEDFENIMREREPPRAAVKITPPTRNEEHYYAIREEPRRERYTLPERHYEERRHAPTREAVTPRPHQVNRQPSRANPRTACRRCGEHGHFAYECQNAIQLFCWSCGRRGVRTQECCRSSPGNGQRLRLMRGVKSSAVPKISYQTPSVLRQTEGRIIASVAINGKPILATIDTGATQSFISKKVAESLKVGPTRRVFKKVLMGDGRPRAVTEAVKATIQMGDKEHTSELLILPGVIDDVVLGTDYLVKANTTISCGGQIIKLKAESETRTKIKCSTMKVYEGPFDRKTKERPKIEVGENEAINCRWLKAKLREVKLAPEKFPDYTLRRGELYHHIPNEEDATPWKLCVATPLRQRVMNKAHGSPDAEHMGIKETVEKAAARYYWPRMFRDIKRYIRQCPRCHITNPSEPEDAGTGETSTTLVVDKETKKRRNKRSRRSTEEEGSAETKKKKNQNSKSKQRTRVEEEDAEESKKKKQKKTEDETETPRVRNKPKNTRRRRRNRRNREVAAEETRRGSRRNREEEEPEFEEVYVQNEIRRRRSRRIEEEDVEEQRTRKVKTTRPYGK
ncbi:unnamed protein product [Ceratitis capitata]|uniref:RNA-directed DNA polymerase n=1 Tax=Ceratitis capitata TaxID=7213 RepID=A0A811VBM5_CERCA|nr:unnamed protein product [Ceratitis capitata]